MVFYMQVISSGWEHDFKRVFAMNKRRLAMLEPLISELNAQHFLNIVRQLCFEVGRKKKT